MGRCRLAVAVGIAACVAVLAVLAWPYFEAPHLLVGYYYGSGLSRVPTVSTLTPSLVALFAVGALVAFAAGRRHSVESETAAGAALVFGLLALAVSLAWAITARLDAFLAPGILLPNQRWILVGAAALVVASAGWYAHALDVL